jgi:hypothetical protein
MKGRIAALLAAAVIGTVAVYAEDAMVLPAGTLRVGTDASIGFVRGSWDGGGKKTDAPDAMIVGASLDISYGFNGWFTAVLDWSPGVTDTDLVGIDISNDGDGEAEIYEGLSDFSLKAHFQIIGHNAPLPSGRFRLRLTPSVVIPFPGIDDKDALGNHAWGIGGGISFDALITDAFFVNVFSEAYWFPFEKPKANNDWEYALEAGPHYALAIGGARLAFALPVHWKATSGNNKKAAADGGFSHLLTLSPALELKLTRPFAVDIRIEYAFPLYGKNNFAVHTITVKAPVYFNFAKDKNGE